MVSLCYDFTCWDTSLLTSHLVIVVISHEFALTMK